MPEPRFTRDEVIAQAKRALEAAYPDDRATLYLREIERGWPRAPLEVSFRDRTVDIVSMQLCSTYVETLPPGPGLPDHEDVIATARGASAGRTPHFFVDPPLKPTDLPRTSPRVGVVQRLPNYWCIARFRSWWPAVPGADEDYSELWVTWFFNAELFPLEIFRELEWNVLSRGAQLL